MEDSVQRASIAVQHTMIAVCSVSDAQDGSGPASVYESEHSMTVPIPLPADQTILPAGLALTRLRLTLRFLSGTTLPPLKGTTLRGGFGYAFQRVACPPTCWGHAAACTIDRKSVV